ncbi:MAG: hypothetical protein JW973_08585 [Bacteroidales bacterium]|nr:hypothetical protein [Bacteroidales bacterium]
MKDGHRLKTYGSCEADEKAQKIIKEGDAKADALIKEAQAKADKLLQ